MAGQRKPIVLRLILLGRRRKLPPGMKPKLVPSFAWLSFGKQFQGTRVHGKKDMLVPKVPILLPSHGLHYLCKQFADP